MSEKKVVSRKVAVALGIVCIILLVLLVGNVYTLNSQISSLNSQVESLRNENSSLKSEISAKNNTIASLNSQITEKDNTISSLNSQIATKDSQISALNSQISQLQIWLEGNITLLNSLKLEKEMLSLWLEGNKTLLAQTQTWLQGNITYYESQIAALNSQIDSLNSQITSLQDEIDSLRAAINTTFQAYVDAYLNLRDKVNQRWNHINIQPFITPQDRAVRDIVYSITGGWSNQSDWNEYWKDVKAMYNWVVNNIEYRSDGLYPILPYDPSGDLDFWNEMWQFPNETLSLRKGDCEDMAILLCSMISCYGDMRYWVECIVIESSTEGHVAVQVPVSGYKLVILDPAGNYYSHDIWGNIAFNDITTEINKWLNYWKPQMGSDVYVARVFSDYIDKTFASTNEYIAWMYSR
jgi:chaperonin cofactor prefoldin